MLGGADRQPVRLLPGRRVQPGHAGPVGQPSAVRPVEGQGDALFHAGDDVPARLQDRRDQVMAGEIPVEADDQAGEQGRAALHEPFQQRLLPGAGLAQDRSEPGAAGALADQISPLPWVGAGVGYVRLEASPDPVRVRAAYVTDTDILAMADAIGSLPGGEL